MKFIERNFLPLLILSLTLSYFLPVLSSIFASKIKLLLSLTILLMGLNLDFEDFKLCLQQPKALCIGISLQYLLMPFFAFTLSYALKLPQEFTLALMLIGCAPGGVASNVMVYLAHGDLALSIGMTFLATTLTPLVLPALMLFYTSNWIEIDFWALSQSTIELILVPILTGLLIQKFIPEFAKASTRFTPSLAIIAVCLIIATMLDTNHSKLVSLESDLMNFSVITRTVLTIVLHNTLGLACAYLIAKILNLGDQQCKAISIEVGLQNSGLAMVFAALHFSPIVAVPCMFSAIWHIISASYLGEYWKRKVTKA